MRTMTPDAAARWRRATRPIQPGVTFSIAGDPRVWTPEEFLAYLDSIPVHYRRLSRMHSAYRRRNR